MIRSFGFGSFALLSGSTPRQYTPVVRFRISFPAKSEFFGFPTPVGQARRDFVRRRPQATGNRCVYGAFKVSVIVAFLEGTKNGESQITATANSSALFETITGSSGGGGGTGVPEPGTAALFMTALMGFGMTLLRRAARSRAAAA